MFGTRSHHRGDLQLDGTKRRYGRRVKGWCAVDFLLLPSLVALCRRTESSYESLTCQEQIFEEQLCIVTGSTTILSTRYSTTVQALCTALITVLVLYDLHT